MKTVKNAVRCLFLGMMVAAACGAIFEVLMKNWGPFVAFMLLIAAFGRIAESL